MLIPEESYRWLASIELLPQNCQLQDKQMVEVPQHLVPHFESGFIIAEIIRSILERTGQKVPASLQSVRSDSSKSTKLTNWNFVWLSFDQLRMQFDPRIKDLILQGQNALIMEIVKQLCDRDENKNIEKMKGVKIREKANGQKGEKNMKNPHKSSSLDVKKINLQKNPNDSDSSLEFLILLLSSSLGLSIEEILGLFTNQNKYLAHVIVKGLNDEYDGILLFYTMLNKYSSKLRQFCENDPIDAYSCFYAIKPGFISKNRQVAELTIQLFSEVGNVYQWLVGENKGATTLLLGMKRHPDLVEAYWALLLDLIQNEEADFFTQHFKDCFRDLEELIEIGVKIVSPLGQSYMNGKLHDLGVLKEWLQLAVDLYQGDITNKILVFQFLGEAMLWLPETVQQNQECLSVFKHSWKQRKMQEYILLIDEVIMILDKLAFHRNNFASKVYQIIIQIYVQVNDTDKRQYLIQNLSLIIPQYPKMPIHFLVEACQEKYLHASDFVLVAEAIQRSMDEEGLTRIGDVILDMFVFDPVANNYLVPYLFKACQKVVDGEIGQAFIKKVVKDGLHSFGVIQTNKKIPQVSKPQPMYFQWKGNSEKLNQNEADMYAIKEREANNLLDMVDRISELSKHIANDTLQTQIRENLLDSNAYVRKHTFKTGSKKLSNILRKFNISKEDEQDYDEQYRNRKAIQEMQNSLSRKNEVAKNVSQFVASRVQGPEHLKKEFNDMIQKRRKEQQQKKEEEERRQRQTIMKETMIKKELEIVKIMKGFGQGEAELKEFGFWDRIIKDQSKEIELYPPYLMETRDTEYIENLFKKYHKAIRFLFTKYTSTMYSIKDKSMRSFDDNHTRKQTINVVELIKLLKDYKLFFLTNSNQIQQLVRDVNVKLINKRQNQELDFNGFEHFLVQFSSTIYTKSHTISALKKKGAEDIKKNFYHLTHYQLLQELFHYIKMVFAEKGQKTTLFDEPETAYFNETEVIKEFNRKIEEDSNFILPEGYKKVTEKIITFNPEYSQNITKGFNQTYLDVYSLLDEIIFESPLNFHLLEPISEKQIKYRVKPSTFANIKPKVMSESMDLRSSIMGSEKRGTIIPPIKMMERKVLSFGMKLGLSYVNYKDKLLGEQVAYVIDDMLTAVEKGRKTIQKEKIVNQIVRKRREMQELQQKNQMEKEKKRKGRKQQIKQYRKEITQKKQQEQEKKKEENDKKKQKKISREIKRKEDDEKYKSDQKAKIEEKKKKQEEDKQKEKQMIQKKKSQEKKAKQKFKQFNKQQKGKLHQKFEKIVEQRKQVFVKQQEEKKHKEEIYKKLRSKIRSDDKKIIQIREKHHEQINQLSNSEGIAEVFKQFQPNLKGIFEFLIKNTFLPISDRKHNNEIIFQSWHYFNYAFQLIPLIISAKEIQNIFRTLTKDKQIRKQYYVGLNFEQFKHALLRIAIKHKTVFNKISEKIKEESMTEKQIDKVIQKDIEEKEKNQFEQPKDFDVKNLLNEEDVNKEIFDDYGDVSKVNAQTLKGLIYYLKVPKEKKNQEDRFREIIVQKIENKHHNYEKLRQKLRQQYTLSPKKKPSGKSSIVKSEQDEKGRKK